MANKSVGGTGKGVIGGRGVMGTPTAANYGGKLPRPGGKGLTGGRGVMGTLTAANYGGVLTRNPSTSLAGGLGMQAYGSPAKGSNLRTPRKATTATRNYQYGEVMGTPSPASLTAAHSRGAA